MNAFWNKKKKSDTNPAPQGLPAGQAGEARPEGRPTWDESAKQALTQALAQAPVPGLLKGKIKRELEQAAEDAAQAAGRTTVTAEDVVGGLLAKMPPTMRAKIEAAMKQGPEALKDLERDLRHQK